MGEQTHRRDVVDRLQGGCISLAGLKRVVPGRGRGGAGAGAGRRAVQGRGCARCSGRRRAGIDAGGARGGRGSRAPPPPVRHGAASARSSPVPALRRAGVSSRAPGGGGEPRAARPTPAARRRARSTPALKPLFLWASQQDGALQRVRIEEYDSLNRIHLTRTRSGWRAFPKTPTFEAIRRGLTPSSPTPTPPPTPPPECAPRRRRRVRSRRRRVASKQSPAWLEPDLESHIPSHKIPVSRVPPQEPPLTPPISAFDLDTTATTSRSPTVESLPAESPTIESLPAESPTVESLPGESPLRSPSAPGAPASPAPPAPSPTTAPSPGLPLAAPPPPQPPEPTALDSLLAVAELEFHHQQRGSELEMEIRGEGARFAFLPPEESPSALFDLGVGKAGEAEEALRDLGAHDDLFESISEAHYLPELGGHDEALLESLVEKGCEDNQILGRLDRLSALASGAEYEEAGLLGEAPVHDIIGRLDALESPSRSAAQGLLHLRHLPQRRASSLDAFAQDDLFAPEAPLPAESQPAEDSRRDGEDHVQVMYSEQVSDLPDGFDYEDYEDIAPSAITQSQSTPVRTDATSSEEVPYVEISQSTEAAEPRNEIDDDDDSDENDLILLSSDIGEIGFKLDEAELVPLQKEEPKEEEEIEKPTDLRKVLEIDNDEPPPISEMSTTELQIDSFPFPESEPSDKIDDLPKDLSIHRRPSSYASPRRIEIPRAPSRESDAMQSPQPSGIPAISSPEVFTAPTSKNKQPSFLESLYAGSTSPKMFTSEVTIQQCGPLNLGKHRKSASPTVSSCSEELRTVHKDAGEPQEKRVRKESHDLAKICNLLKKSGENKLAEAKQKKKQSESEQLPPLKQLDLLKSNKNFNLPDHILVPRDRLSKIISAPGKEIPALLMEKPQLNLAEILEDPNFMGDPELMVISLEQIRQLIIHNVKSTDKSKKPSDTDHDTHTKERTKEIDKETVSTKSKSKNSEQNKPSSSERTPSRNTPQPSVAAEQSSTSTQPRGIPPMGHLADDIDAANSAAAAAYHHNWLPAYMAHMSQLEAMAVCSQNPEFLKAFGSTGAYANANYANLSQMFHPSRLMNFPMIPGMVDYDSRVAAQMALYHEMAAQTQRHKHAGERPSSGGRADHRKEAPTPPSPYAHFAKSQPPTSKHSSHASPLAAAAAYTSAQQRAAHAQFMNAYPGYELRTPAQDIQIPYYTPPGSQQRSPRGSHSKSPTSPYFPNNNYLHSSKEPARGASGDRGRPRISVKPMQELQKTNSMSCHGAGSQLPALLPASLPRRQEPEVGSTTSAGEPPPLPPQLQHMPHMQHIPHPHDPTASGTAFWHPLFSNQKGYTSPWSWTTVTATGD